MRYSFLSWALFVTLIASCRGAGELIVNEDLIDIDGVNEEGLPAALLRVARADGGSGDGAVVPTDDEDILDNLEGSGTTIGNNNIVDNGNQGPTFTTVSSHATSNNEIPQKPNKPTNTDTNHIGPMYEETNERNTNDALNGDASNVAKEPQNFFQKIIGNPAILAGMVGAVVLILLTVVLLFLFVVYRIKKKDEGSYSLDEPHKVKDPTAYWKDTKEFYA